MSYLRTLTSRLLPPSGGDIPEHSKDIKSHLSLAYVSVHETGVQC